VATTNPYLEGNFAPVSREVSATELPVHGHIPDTLCGRYLRNGPNPVSPPDPASYHWFTGDGMVHGVRLRDGRAEWYRNRWVRAEHVAQALGEERRPGPPPHGDMDLGPNTNVIGHAGRTFALVEAGARPFELTSELESIGPTDLGGTLSGGYTAHPKRDPDSGELYAVSYFWGWGNDVEVTVIDAEAKVRSARRVSLGGPTSLHDCAITERFVVLLDLPVLFSIEAVQQGALFPYRWQEGYHSRVGLLPRDGQSTDVLWHDIEPCYVFHFMNAYDDGEGVVLDVVRYDSVFGTSVLGPDESAPTLDRWHLDGHGGPVKEEQLDDRAQEFPRVDERVVGRPHRYGYAVSSPIGPGARTEGALIRHDFAAGTSTVRRLGSGATPGEAVFVPRALDAAEDDGWLLALVHSQESDSSALHILDAADLTRDPQAVIELPQRVPVGFHGNWVPDLA
jgi:carotenoid cleavage dioxygenase